MRSFLSEVVTSLYDRYADDISSLKVVLPSRRAALFFTDALSDVALRPLWQPDFVGINDLMERVAGVKGCDNIQLITELYKVYSRYHSENFDTFYFWGDMLLSDFNQIDKYLIDADMLFANIGDLKEIERDHSYLTDEQIEVILRFWRNFSINSPDKSQEKERFWAIWSTLSKIYHEFREVLQQKGLAYDGMVQRIATQKIIDGTTDFSVDNDRYVVAGFNALTECEKRLFSWLEKSGRVEFFWDYDNYYIDNADNEAGLFLRENVRSFHSDNADDVTHDHFCQPKDITVVASPSNSLQCKYVYTFLQEIIQKGGVADKRTAIVLTDESLLLPILHSIPEEVDKVNVTMGHELRQTTVYSFIERLLSLQQRKRSTKGRLQFYHTDVTGLLNHPYIQELFSEWADDMIADIVRRQRVYIPSDAFADKLGYIFCDVASWSDMSEYIRTVLQTVGKQEASGESTVRRREIFSLVIDRIAEIGNSLEDCGVDITLGVYTSLIRRILQNVRMPYEGEPLEGVQIMGILETRNLDFDNVLILSANDDNFPGNASVTSSFIPYNLRYAYGLPTPRHHDGVYAYYFYRLLQRASNVHICYCSLSDDKHTGEPSRYIYQLDYESPHNLIKRDIPLVVNLLGDDTQIVVPKDAYCAGVLDKYKDGGGYSLSPTAFYTYIECPLKFYFKYIASITVDKEISEEIDLPMFGTILHKAMELLYQPLLNVPDPAGRIANFSTETVYKAVNDAVNSEYVRDDSISDEDYSGNVILVRDIVFRYIKNAVLPYDTSRNSYIVKDLERRVGCVFNGVSFGGIADRIDLLKDGMVQVIDYKTGSRHIEFASVDALFSENPKERSSAVLQTMIYAMIMWHSERCDVQPALYYVRYMNNPDFSPLLIHGNTPVFNFSQYRYEFEENVQRVLSEMFDLSQPFKPCSDIGTCQYCDFKAICRR